MEAIFNLVKRNLKVYFRDKSAVFFSFLSVIIIVILYALFLADMQVQSIKAMAGEVKGIRFLVDSWIMAGLIAVNTLTISLGALAVMVKDQDKKIMRDFLVAPLNRSAIVISYILSTLVIGLIICLSGLGLMELYIVLFGGHILSWGALGKVILIIMISLVSSTSFMFLITSFIRSGSAFSTLSAITGSVVGFLAGIYVPIGTMPPVIQTFMKVFPTAISASLLRQVFMEEPIRQVFGRAPVSIVENYQTFTGIIFKIKGQTISPGMMIVYLSCITVVFTILGILRVRTLRAK